MILRMHQSEVDRQRKMTLEQLKEYREFWDNHYTGGAAEWAFCVLLPARTKGKAPAGPAPPSPRHQVPTTPAQPSPRASPYARSAPKPLAEI